MRLRVVRNFFLLTVSSHARTTRPMPRDTVVITRARRRLVQWMKRNERTQTWLASVLGVRQTSVNLWVHGLARPEEHLRAALAVITCNDVGVPMWRTRKEQALVNLVCAEYGPTVRRSRKKAA
jgi:hypothetical protein